MTAQTATTSKALDWQSETVTWADQVIVVDAECTKASPMVRAIANAALSFDSTSELLVEKLAEAEQFARQMAEAVANGYGLSTDWLQSPARGVAELIERRRQQAYHLTTLVNLHVRG
ncbi:MAG TPA: hypothetical protein VFV01_47920 [Spirillospora sp.]|nr:hypothetical protein [Spirillospora sp.]